MAQKSIEQRGVTGAPGGGEPGALASPTRPRVRGSVLASAALAVFVVGWAVTNLAVEGQGFAVLVSEKIQGVEESASAMARFFGALVLALFFVEGEGWRLRWIAGGLVVLGLGHLAFGYVEPILQDDPAELNEALYESLVARIFACALFVVGLIPRRRPPRWVGVAVTALAVAPLLGYIVVFEFLHGEEWMPPLAGVETARDTLDFGTPLAWLTPWHWALSAVPLALALLVAAGAFRQGSRGLLPGWLLLAMVLLSGALVHEYLWPSTYSSVVLTTGGTLSLAFAVVIVVGGVFELRRVASERTALLSTERERVRRMGELATLRADFSAMVAHELDGPLAAIRRLVEMLDAAGSDPKVRAYATPVMEEELDALDALVADVRTAAAVERDDFEVSPRAIPLGDLLCAAEAFARTLAGEHPVEVVLQGDLDPAETVWADRERIGQVIRNLLSNAAKYSPAGAPIELRARRAHGRAHGRAHRRVRLEVADAGPGIHPEDATRIFEKFGRGRDRQGRKVAGVGLGLYLSRRIVQAHGGDMTLKSEPGRGSVFGFDLEVAR